MRGRRQSVWGSEPTLERQLVMAGCEVAAIYAAIRFATRRNFVLAAFLTWIVCKIVQSNWLNDIRDEHDATCSVDHELLR